MGSAVGAAAGAPPAGYSCRDPHGTAVPRCMGAGTEEAGAHGTKLCWEQQIRDRKPGWFPTYLPLRGFLMCGCSAV